MALPSLSKAIAQTKNPLVTTVLMFAVIAMAFIPEIALAFPDAASGGVGEAQAKVCGFFTNASTLLNAASVIVVTVAVIFAGYQIAFAHKRISDVAPAIIGGVVIGAAAQIAKMVVNNDGADTCTAMISTLHAFQNYA